MRNKLCLTGLLILLMIFTGACASDLGRQTDTLLQRDYLVMDDEQLLGYYRRLGDQLVQETRAGREGGLLTRPAETDRLDRLRQRWNEVRAEMDRRQLSP